MLKTVNAAEIALDGEPGGMDRIDFETEILPIFQAHCFECHSGKENDGDLKLDERESIRRGGHTGRPLITESLETSELYLRLISTDQSYRMPKGSRPLSASEIALVKRWLEEGSVWGNSTLKVHAAGTESPSASGSLPSENASQGVLESLGVAWHELNELLKQPRFRYFPVIASIAGAWVFWFILSLLWRRIGNSPRVRFHSSVPRESQRESGKTGQAMGFLTSWRFNVIFLIAVLCTAVFLIQQGRLADLQVQLESAQSQIRTQALIRLTTDRKSLALPVHPFHPPRLGGVYYRGNDERSPELFNGGVYRTATMELWLVDQDLNRLAWNDLIENRSLAILLKIKRAPRTTVLLFNEHIFNQTYLRRFRETDLIPDDQTDESVEISMTPLDVHNEWQVLLPLEPVSNWKASETAGVAYLFYGTQMADGFRGRPHFGIRYDLKVIDGKISADSVLWMGSIYDLGGRVLIPQEKELLLDHWFDYRPIPEIEADHSQDAELLGLPEHLKSKN
jgi:hypothetical protein